MKKNHRAYWIVNNLSLFDDRPELIFSTKTVIDPEFDSKQLPYKRDSLTPRWPNNVSVYITGHEPVDFLLCTPYLEIVSDRAKGVIEELAQEEVEFLPVKVYHNDGTPYKEMNFWVWHVMTFLDALDWENTMWIKPSAPQKDDPLAFLSIIKPCLKTQVIENHHLYGLEVGGKIRSSKFVSPVLKERLIMSGCSIGIEFSPVKTT